MSDTTKRCFTSTDQENPVPMVVGKKYKVEWDDCCVEGAFIATFVGLRNDDDEMEFDNGAWISTAIYDEDPDAPVYPQWGYTVTPQED